MKMMRNTGNLHVTPASTSSARTLPVIRLVSLFALACTAMLLVLCLAPGLARAADAFVIDEYGLLSDDQAATLEKQAEAIAEESGIGAYLLITDSIGGSYNATSSERNSFAQQYFFGNSLGLGSNHDGVLFVIAVDSRDYVTWGNGLPWTEALSKKGVETLEEAVTSHLSDDDWYGGCAAYYREVGSQLHYYVLHGKAEEPLDLVDWLIRLGIVFGIPLIVAIGYVVSGISAMRTAKRKTEAGDYLQSGSLVVTQATDRFLHTTHTATKRSDDNDSGGGGGWGGGGSFGGSGGGKF